MSQCIRILVLFGFVMRHAKCEDLWRNISNHPTWKILDTYDCGFSASDRIIGGIDATLGQFPWIVRLGFLIKEDGKLDWLCGGVLVTDRHVVTAAHCLESNAGDIELKYIRMGEYDAKTEPDCQLQVCAPPVQDRRHHKVKSHPSFNKPPFHNDIAIIELDAPVVLNDYVLPICLPRAEQLQGLNVSELVTVAGWGKMNLTTDERATILQYISLPIVKPEICDSLGRGFKLMKTEICAGAQLNKDACVGDSGGPLMKVFDTPDGPKSFLMGIVSFGPTICGIKKPGVYTSVPEFLKWILDNIVF